MVPHRSHAEESISALIRRDFIVFEASWTVEEALKTLREKTDKADDILYFYIQDARERLLGVVPVRRLLISEPATRLDSIMIQRLVTLREETTLMEACQAFVQHRFLSLPVVNADRRLIGVLDATRVNNEIIDFSEKQASDEMFERIGVRLEATKDASPWSAFRFRFPWLTATLISGTTCAVLASLYEITLAESIILTFFLALVLGLGESVSMQSMTVTIQQLRIQKPNFRWAAYWFPREFLTAMLIGLTCGSIVASIVGIWRQNIREMIVIGVSICLTIIIACLIGRLVPFALHALKLDPKVSAGPLTLGLADIFTLLIYFNLARLIF